eukprot:9479566-Pyramimonas_sp.AAC.2
MPSVYALSAPDWAHVVRVNAMALIDNPSGTLIAATTIAWRSEGTPRALSTPLATSAPRTDARRKPSRLDRTTESANP